MQLDTQKLYTLTLQSASTGVWQSSSGPARCLCVGGAMRLGVVVRQRAMLVGYPVLIVVRVACV